MFVREQSYVCVLGSSHVCVLGSSHVCVLKVRGHVCVLGVSILSLLLRFVDQILELFRHCGIYCFSFILSSVEYFVFFCNFVFGMRRETLLNIRQNTSHF